MNKTLSAYFLKRRDDFYRILQEMALVSAPNVRMTLTKPAEVAKETTTKIGSYNLTA